MTSEKAAAVFQRVEERFDRTERAHRAFLIATGEAKLDALADLVVWGRSVTNVMENLRHMIPGFDEWFKPHTAAMGRDAALRRFYLMRTDVLKRGVLSVEKATIIFSMEPWKFRPEPPPGATHFIVHDEATDKWGWLVKRPDGTEEKVLYDYPEDVKKADLLTFTPALQDTSDYRVEDTAVRYVEYLRNMVDELRIMVLRASN